MGRIQINEVSLELLTAVDGPPLLVLHGGAYFAQHREFFDKLARHWRVVVPRHPGFGNSERPDCFRTVHDLAYLYLELLERQDFGKATLAGSSFGGGGGAGMCRPCLSRHRRPGSSRSVPPPTLLLHTPHTSPAVTRPSS